jgi:two-component system cell cycle sensor histidine kinase/response regulator CckA
MQILLIDDDAAVLRALTRMLRPHVVTATTSASGALAMIRHGQPFDAVLCDLRMPDMIGRDFYAALRGFAPALASRTVFISGGICNPEDAAFAKIHATLMKPFTKGELSLALWPLLPVVPPLCA